MLGLVLAVSGGKTRSLHALRRERGLGAENVLDLSPSAWISGCILFGEAQIKLIKQLAVGSWDLGPSALLRWDALLRQMLLILRSAVLRAQSGASQNHRDM